MRPINHEGEGVYRFEGFLLDPARRLLLKEGETVQLTPKAFDTLLVLVRQRGRVVGKDELMGAIWPDTVVEETNLAHNISALRKILGQKAGENRFIVTLPGRGYSFVADVWQEADLSAEDVSEAGSPLQVEADQVSLMEDEPPEDALITQPLVLPDTAATALPRTGLPGPPPAPVCLDGRRPDRVSHSRPRDLGVAARAGDAYPVRRRAAVQAPGERPAR